MARGDFKVKETINTSQRIPPGVTGPETGVQRKVKKKLVVVKDVIVY